MAMPTLVATPCPSGPVVVSTPEVQRYSGCPAQRLPNCRKDLRSSSVTEGRPRISYSGSTAFTLARCRIVYNKVDACPAESTKRSRFIQMGSLRAFRGARIDFVVHDPASRKSESRL